MAESEKLNISLKNASSKLTKAERLIKQVEVEANQKWENFKRDREKIELALKNSALAYQNSLKANEFKTKSEELLKNIENNLSKLFNLFKKTKK